MGLNKSKELPRYTGLKDFARGVQKLYKMHGNIPVFLGIGNDMVAPFGIAIQMSELLGGEAIVLEGGFAGTPRSFEKGTVTA